MTLSTATTSTLATATTSVIPSVSSASSVVTSVWPSFISSWSSCIATFCFSSNHIRIQVSLSKHFTFTDPYLDPDLSIHCKREYICVVNVHTKRMQWGTSLFDFFSTGYFRTTQTTGYFYLDTFSTHSE